MGKVKCVTGSTAFPGLTQGQEYPIVQLAVRPDGTVGAIVIDDNGDFIVTGDVSSASFEVTELYAPARVA